MQDNLQTKHFGHSYSNAIFERNLQFLGNLLWTCNITKTYVDENNPWSIILAAAAFSILSTKNRLKFYSLVQLLLGRDMILLIKHKVDWEIIHHQNLEQINKDNIR